IQLPFLGYTHLNDARNSGVPQPLCPALRLPECSQRLATRRIGFGGEDLNGDRICLFGVVGQVKIGYRIARCVTLQPVAPDRLPHALLSLRFCDHRCRLTTWLCFLCAHLLTVADRRPMLVRPPHNGSGEIYSKGDLLQGRPTPRETYSNSIVPHVAGLVNVLPGTCDIITSCRAVPELSLSLAFS